MAGRGAEHNPLFVEQVPGSLRLAVWVLLLAVLMVLDYRHHWLLQTRAFTGKVLDPIFTLLELPDRAGRQLSTWLVEHQSLQARKQQLEQDNIRLRVQLRQWRALLQDQQQIQTLLQPQVQASEQSQVARVVALNSHPFGTRVLINRGAADGIETGMAALDSQGVAGQVITVLPHHAWVMLISDPDHALPVQLQRTGVRSIVVGRGQADELEAMNLPLSADIQHGDMLETSGIGGRFPPHYPVAVVTHVERVPGERFAHVRVRPLAALDRLQFLVLSRGPAPP